MAPYFAEVVAAIRSELFDTLGHLDYVKKYVAEHVPPAAFAAAPDVYEPILRALVETGTGLEVNASGLRQAPGRPTRRRGSWPASGSSAATIVTAGSDAHRAAARSPTAWRTRTGSPPRRGSTSWRSGALRGAASRIERVADPRAAARADRGASASP